MSTEVILGDKTYTCRADFEALERLESYFPRGWKWFKEVPRIFAEGATIEEARNFFRALVVVPVGQSRLTPLDITVLFSTRINAYVEAHAAAIAALEIALDTVKDPKAKTTGGEGDKDPQ